MHRLTYTPRSAVNRFALSSLIALRLSPSHSLSGVLTVFVGKLGSALQYGRIVLP